MVIRDWLLRASDQLADALIPSARLDAEIILAHTLNRPRTWLHAHANDELDQRRRDIADTRIDLRLERVPVAYIIGHKEFYGRLFHVSPSTLIPRPESEAVIAMTLGWLNTHPSAAHVVDVGTGSGCLGITLALEAPDHDYTLIDTSTEALKVAQQNSTGLGAKARLLQSDLLAHYPLTADVIVANPPYVDTSWQVSADTAHEPGLALYADDNGLKLIKRLIDDCPEKLARGGLLVLEADPRQHDAIIDYARAGQLRHDKTDGFALSLAFEHAT